MSKSTVSSKIRQTVRATVPTEVKDVVRTRLLSMLSKRTQWNGTMTELNDAIRSFSGRAVPSEWPGSASVLRRVVNTVVHSIRKAGYRVEFSRTPDRERRRVVSFSRRESK